MLRGSSTSNLFVVPLASVSTVHYDGLSQFLSYWIEYVLYQCNDILLCERREFAAASADELLFLEVFHGDFGFRWRVEGFGSYIGPRPYAGV